ncbi:unnamed protein product [Somion occarium]|uniref:DUF726-domain-containing protein n=2 Tax=Somion occarium TaxID=3059160 RepID=A0ABP1CG97_9APHY
MVAQSIVPIEPSVFEDDDEGWQDMPVVRESDEFANGLDEEDQKKYHYVPSAKKVSSTGASNATGNLLDIDFRGNEWRSKVDQNESEYTRLRVNEEDESDEVHLRTRYLFDEDKAMTPLSQMQTTKDLLTEAQRIAYVGLCALTAKEMADKMRAVNQKELKQAIKSLELWSLKIMEQKMIESLATHGIEAKDLVPPLMTTHTVANPEYDPVEARKQAEQEAKKEDLEAADRLARLEEDSFDISEGPDRVVSTSPSLPNTSTDGVKPVQTTAKVFEDTSAAALPGVSTHLSAADEKVTLDIRWTVLCDLFLTLIADSVYDARSRVLLENVALKLGLGWLDVVKFERRVTEALEIQEEVEKMEQKEAIEDVRKASKKKRYMMLGLATLGGGLVIGLSAGLLAPVIGAGLGAAFTTIGITGTTGFLAGAGGAAVITTGGVLTGSGIAARGMARRTQFVRTFDILPLHNNKRVNCILTVSGFMNGQLDDVRLPFSVLDPVIGDVFSVLWEPEMIRETGGALKILTGEVLSQIGQTVLQATVMTALMSALQWPIILTKLGYLIDNPWNNALDRAKAAGSVLADILIHRHLGVRPITLIGFSLGARVIFYALLELAKQKAYGTVQDVFLLGTTVTAPTRTWIAARSVVSGRFVNGYARNDWVLNYLFRATSGGLNTVAGLRPVENVPGLENVDVTDKISGHMSYRTFMPLILDQLGFPVSADYFDEPEEPDFEGDRIVVREGEELQKKSWFSRKKKPAPAPSTPKISRPPSSATFGHHRKTSSSTAADDDDLPPREIPTISTPLSPEQIPIPATPVMDDGDVGSPSNIPLRAGFDFSAIKEVLGKADLTPAELQVPAPNKFNAPYIPPPTHRSESAPPPGPGLPVATPRVQSSFDLPSTNDHLGPVASAHTNTHDDLTSSLSRSLSLTDLRDETENDMTSLGSKTPTSSAYTQTAPSVWPEELTPSYGSASFSSFHDRSPPYGTGISMRSGDAFPFGSEQAAQSSDGLYSSPLLSGNPFAPPDTAALSFGGVDGSISLSPSPKVERDPWDIAPPMFGSGSKKSASTLNLNPWQS